MRKASRIDQRMRALALAQDCAKLGARVRTIHHLTGLPPKELQRLLFSTFAPAPRGRTPNTREWYHTANVLYRTESSLVAANFRRLRQQGFAPAETLVAVYRYYQSVHRPPSRISFDRAFDLVAHTEGIWIAKEASFRVVLCSRCGSEFLDAPSTDAGDDRHCPFCQLLDRHERDHRLTASSRDQTAPTHPQILVAMRGLLMQGHAAGEIPATSFAFPQARPRP